MSEHFDRVVAGPGFGGSLMPHRLAQTGLRVCLPERGNGYPAGYRDPSAGLHRLFNIPSFPGAGALVSSALGGGSHICTNVLIRIDEHRFEERDPNTRLSRPWPVKRVQLDQHHDAAGRPLNAQECPQATAPFNRIEKKPGMQQAAAHFGLAWHPPSLALGFLDRPDNAPSPALTIAALAGPRHGYRRGTLNSRSLTHGYSPHDSRLFESQRRARQRSRPRARVGP